MSHVTRRCLYDSSHRPEGSTHDNTQPVALSTCEFVRMVIVFSFCLFLRMGDLTMTWLQYISVLRL